MYFRSFPQSSSPSRFTNTFTSNLHFTGFFEPQNEGSSFIFSNWGDVTVFHELEGFESLDVPLWDCQLDPFPSFGSEEELFPFPLVLYG